MRSNAIVPAGLRGDALVAASRAHVTAAQTDAMPMQAVPCAILSSTALARSDLGRLHSSGQPDASYVANSMAKL